MEVVERRVVVDLHRVGAGGDRMELVDQEAVGVAQLDGVVILDVACEDGQLRCRRRTDRERGCADERADGGSDRGSGYVLSPHSAASPRSG
jgi:hypothetical protein